MLCKQEVNFAKQLKLVLKLLRIQLLLNHRYLMISINKNPVQNLNDILIRMRNHQIIVKLCMILLHGANEDNYTYITDSSFMRTPFLYLSKHILILCPTLCNFLVRIKIVVLMCAYRCSIWKAYEENELLDTMQQKYYHKQKIMDVI